MVNGIEFSVENAPRLYHSRPRIVLAKIYFSKPGTEKILQVHSQRQKRRQCRLELSERTECEQFDRTK